MGEVLCVIPGPSRELKREPDDREARWCFRCRRRGRHEWVLLGDPDPSASYWAGFADWPELDGYAAATIVWPSYYDPQWFLRCPTCGEDHTAFPGREWLL